MRARLRAAAVVFLMTVLGMGALVSSAFADGDPGSDVLVYQSYFVAGDAGLSVTQQAQLGSLLQSGDRAGFPVRVAIISSPADLGAVTALWRKPQQYASFLGYELSLSYKQRLLVVMPDGFGLNWPGHSTAAMARAIAHVPIGSGGTGLFDASEAAVRTMAAASGVRLGGAGVGSGGAATRAALSAAPPSLSAAPETPSSTGASAVPGHGTDSSVAAVTGALALILVLFFGGRFLVRRRRASGSAGSGSAGSGSGSARRARRPVVRLRHLVPGFALLLVLGAATPIVLLHQVSGSPSTQRAALATNPNLDPGTQLNSMAPNFTLIDQFGRRVSLRSFRGKVVVLAFTDSECTTICPMTTTAMLDAKAMLGPAAASHVQLLGVDANPASTSIADVSSYSQLHGMTNAWDFLTGSLPQLQRVWKGYSIEADIESGLISHTPALFIITPQGRESRVYITQQSYAAIGQFGQILAQQVSDLLPSHPAVHSHLSYAPVKSISPAETVSLPRSGGGSVTLGPGRSAHLYVFFATWDQEITSLGGNLDALNRYQASAARSGLPPLTAVDEGEVEPTDQALPDFLHTLAHPLSYPVAIDRSGQVADGYEVLGQPWFVLTSSTGRILWYWQVSTSGWPSDATVSADVRSAMTRSPSAPATSAQVTEALAGSPAPLAALHDQADKLLGSQTALEARIRSLRGYPIVVNAWASWCPPCQAEYSLFAAASAEYGKRVAFIGADTNDSAGNAQSFLAQHPVSYPSYQTNSSDLESLAATEGLPTTIFINRSGKVVSVHDGQYFTQGALDGDIAHYELGQGDG